MSHETSLLDLPGRAIRYAKFRLRQEQVKRQRPKLVARAFERAEELKPTRKPVEKAALLLPTASPGNLGDDAVFRATVAELRRDGYDPVTVISFGEDEKYGIEGADTVVLPLHHSPKGEDYLAFVELLQHYSHYFIWGADIVDGTHNMGVVEPRVVMANLAARMGVKVNLCSFSVSDRRTTPAMDLFRTFDKGVVIQCRDSVSADRLRKELPDHDIQVTADLAFMLTPDHEAPTSVAARTWIDARRAEGKTIMGININDLFCSYFGIPREDLLNAFAKAITDLHESNPEIAFIHIPHDTHANKKLGKMTDFTLAAELNKLLPPPVAEEAFMPGESLSAPEVRAICSYIDLVFSSRMHLSIASLAVGTPVFALAYQGKFEGLFAHFGLEDMFFTHEKLSDDVFVFDFLRRSYARREEVREKVAVELPRIKALSKRNLEI